MQTHEVLDTQAVDIGIIGDALLGKVTTEIGAVVPMAIANCCRVRSCWR